jgi:PPK2 family polyphosphate:nucleotide phosphotransferase
MNISKFRVQPGEKARLDRRDTAATDGYKNKEEAKGKLVRDIARMREYQDVFYAADTYSLLIIFQALDAAGKDGAIKHVMSGLNPQGCQVAAFKSPNSTELDHDYLWRCNVHLPERGRIGIFNRSYYEEVLITRVHPEIMAQQKLPPEARKGNIWKRRFDEINQYESYLHANGTRIIKFFLHLSKAEQKRRFIDRIDRLDKNWKMSPNDAKERERWDDYQHAYEDALTHTSTEHAPWHVIPADHKWFARVAIADIIVTAMKSLKLRYPKVSAEKRHELEEVKRVLLAE